MKKATEMYGFESETEKYPPELLELEKMILEIISFLIVGVEYTHIK